MKFTIITMMMITIMLITIMTAFPTVMMIIRYVLANCRANLVVVEDQKQLAKILEVVSSSSSLSSSSSSHR